jgi:hypothetical protein
MNIGFSGCSYTAGAELIDPIKERYSAIVCDRFQATEHNVAGNNYSNEMVCKKTWDLTNTVSLDFMIIQISSFLRFSFVYDDKLVTINPYRKQKYDYDFVSKIVYSKQSSYDKWYELTRWKILMLHEYLLSRSINHMFLFMLDIDAKSFEKDVFVPQTIKQRAVFDSMMGITESKDLGFFKGKHPSAIAHKYIAEEVVIPKMRALL